MNNSFIKLLNDKGDIKVYKYMEIPDSDPLHEISSYYEEYVYNVFDLLKENQQLKKQKDDVVEYIKYQLSNFDFEKDEDVKAKMLGAMILIMLEDNRMLGEIDEL